MMETASLHEADVEIMTAISNMSAEFAAHFTPMNYQLGKVSVAD